MEKLLCAKSIHNAISSTTVLPHGLFHRPWDWDPKILNYLSKITSCKGSEIVPSKLHALHRRKTGSRRADLCQGCPESPDNLWLPETTSQNPDGGLSRLAGLIQSHHLGHTGNHHFPYLSISREQNPCKWKSSNGYFDQSNVSWGCDITSFWISKVQPLPWLIFSALQNEVWGQKYLDLDVALVLTAMYLWASHISSPSHIVPGNGRANHPSHKLLSTCSMSSAVLGATSRAVNKIDHNSTFMADIQVGITIGPWLQVFVRTEQILHVKVLQQCLLGSHDSMMSVKIIQLWTFWSLFKMGPSPIF